MVIKNELRARRDDGGGLHPVTPEMCLSLISLFVSAEYRLASRCSGFVFAPAGKCLLNTEVDFF